MKLFTFYFPVNLDADLKNIKFTPPYTITKVLHQEMSHYVGYTLKDSTDTEVDVLNLIDLRDYVKTNETEFTNVKINDAGHMEIDKFEYLPLEESLEYSKFSLNHGLYNLLNMLEVEPMPSKVYKYTKKKIDSSLSCTFTSEFNKYLKNICKTHNSKIVIPKPLYTYKGQNVDNFSSLFKKLDFSTNEVDLSLVDLKNASQVDELFYEAKFNNLNLKMLNLPSNIISTTKMFSNFKCEILNLDDCDWSLVDEWVNLFYNSFIKKITANNFICHKKVKLDNIFTYAYIDEIDLNLFANSKRSFDICLFNNLTCKKLLNSKNLNFNNNSKISTKNDIKKPGFFFNLNIPVLDTTQFNFSNITNFDMIFSNIICDKFIFDPKIFDKVTSAKKMFSGASIKEGLDLSSVNMSKLGGDGAIGMFESFITENKLTPPKTFGNASIFDEFFSDCIVNNIDIKNCDFGNAESLDSFFNNTTSIEGICFSKSSNFKISNLLSCNNMFLYLKTPFIDISNLNFDKIDENEFNYLIDYDKNNAILTCNKGYRVLNCNVNYFVTEKGSNFYKFLTKSKEWNHYYDVKDENNQTLFIRDTEIIKESTDSNYIDDFNLASEDFFQSRYSNLKVYNKCSSDFL